MTNIVMPKLSDSMEEGLVLQWLIGEGERVNVGDELVEIETDKATVIYQSEDEGVLSIVVAGGTTVPVGELIATLGADVGPAQPRDHPSGRAGAPFPLAPADIADSTGNGQQPIESVLATPVARRLATLHGVALATIQGTGPRGRITKADVLGAAGQSPPARLTRREPPRTPERKPPEVTDGDGRRHELTRTQRLIARRMAEAKATIPHFQVQTEVVMDRALALRDELKRIVVEPEPVPSINDLIVRASALALRAHPRANGTYAEGHFELHERVNVGVAVAADDALIVPTVVDADQKTLTRIAADTRRLAARVRAGEITPAELAGATFTVSNLGMYGMTAIVPVINPPQAAILGVGAIRATLARDDDDGGRIVDRSLVTLTLSCDHRILYGADAARFLADIRALLEQPLKLLL